MSIRRKHTPLSEQQYDHAAAEPASPSPWALERVRHVVIDGSAYLQLFVAGSGLVLDVPVSALEALAGAQASDLDGLTLSPARDTLIVDRLDAHISVEGLFKQFGPSHQAFNSLFGAPKSS